MVELLNILLNASRKLPNDAEYGHFCRKLILSAKETQGDSSTLQELSSKIFFEINNNIT